MNKNFPANDTSPKTVPLLREFKTTSRSVMTREQSNRLAAMQRAKTALTNDQLHPVIPAPQAYGWR